MAAAQGTGASQAHRPTEQVVARPPPPARVERSSAEPQHGLHGSPADYKSVDLRVEKTGSTKVEVQPRKNAASRGPGMGAVPECRVSRRWCQRNVAAPRARPAVRRLQDRWSGQGQSEGHERVGPEPLTAVAQEKNAAAGFFFVDWLLTNAGRFEEVTALSTGRPLRELHEISQRLPSFSIGRR